MNKFRKSCTRFEVNWGTTCIIEHHLFFFDGLIHWGFK